MKVTIHSQFGERCEIISVTHSPFLVGRSHRCDLQTHLPFVSRRHCELWIDDSQVFVRDLGSRNGTFVNKERVDGERNLRHGDMLGVGRLEYEVLISGLPTESEPHHESGVPALSTSGVHICQQVL